MLAAAMAIGFASCTSEDELAQSNYPADNVVRVTTSVEGMKTRASYTTDNLKEFAFCIVNANSSDKYSYNNIKMTKDGTAWTPSKQMLWQNATQPVDIIAYAPFDKAGNTEKMNEVSKYPFSVELQQSAGSFSSDFLVYKKKGFVPGQDLKNGAVDITFTHALSLLNINIQFGTDFNKTTPLASNPITNIKIGGSINKGYADFTADALSVLVDATASASLIAPEVGDFNAAANSDDHATANYSAILIPQTIAQGFRVEFEIDGKMYVWTASESVKLEASKKHQLNLTVGKDLTKTGNIVASPWKDGEGGTLETD